MRFELGTRCWIPDNRLGWLGVNVTKVEYDEINKKYRIELASDDNNSECFIVETNNLNENNEKLPKLRNLDDTVDDLTTLSHLNEPSVLNSVKLRYLNMKKIYTFSGVVLIALNPFDKVDELYTQNIIYKYQNANKEDNPPHLFAISDEAYKLMKQNQVSQSIIVSGESGAGKTVSAKYIMRFFASVHTEGTQINTIEIEKQILATNPIMESFGNAKTIRNDNSSRFGKYLKISFDEKSVICGAKIQTYLLERSRLVYQAEDERNYHIFYQMIEGLDSKLKYELHLTDAKDYYYLNRGKIFTIKGVDDSKDFKETCDALRVVGITDQQQFELFKILSGLLHIGNIKIQNSRNEAILNDDEPNLLIASTLLGLDPKDFRKWIIKKKISTRSDNIVSNLKFHEAYVAKDSVSKYIYSLLFDWLVSYINNDMCSADEGNAKSFIGVLDIYGFEHFETNSFEQFCINYANEKLQQEFTYHVFKLQQEDYINEGIEWSFIKFSDNQACIDVIENRDGIFSLLDEQCKLPSGSDKAWSEKMFHSLTKPPYNEVFKKARFGHEKFIVCHYALDVSYEIDGFLEKNRDTVSDALNGVLKDSKNQFLTQILSAADKFGEASMAQKRRSLGSRNRKPTLGNLFRTSLNDLMNTINSTNAHYIRCIKPNEEKKAWEFENLMVLSQLRACGVLETIRISLVGFPSKYTYEEFLHKFCVLLPIEDEDKFKKGGVKIQDDLKKLSTKILRSLIHDHLSFQLGKTKIFFRAGVLGQLEIAKTNKIKISVIIIQKNLRCYLMKKKWQEARDSMIELQSHIRGCLIRQRELRERDAATSLQSLFRGFIIREKMKKYISTVIVLQSFTRGAIARLLYKTMVKNKKDEEERTLQREIKEKEEMINQKKALEEAECQKKIEEEKMIAQIKAEKEAELSRQKAEAKLIEYERVQTVTAGVEHQDEIQSRKIDVFESDSMRAYSNFTTTSASDNEEEEELWHIVENKLAAHQLKYSYNDLLGMRPSKALSIITRFMSIKIKNITESIDFYQSKHPNVSTDHISQKLEQSTQEDIYILKKMMKRVKYCKPVMAVNKSSVRNVNSITTDMLTFGQVKVDPDHLDRTFKSGYADLQGYLIGSPVVSTLVAKLLLQGVEQPAEESDEGLVTPIPGDVLFPARISVAILMDLWQIGEVYQSAIFLDTVIQVLKDHIKTLKDPESMISTGAYLLNNLNEIRTCIAWSRYTAMSDFTSKAFKADERNNYLKMLLIMKRYCETVFGQMYNLWVKAILHELKKKMIDAVILDDSLYKNRNSGNLKGLMQGRKFKMFDINRIYNNVYIAMKSYCFDEVISTSVMHDLLTYTDIICFNDIITRKSYLTVDRGMQLKFNISLLIDWCNEHNIPDAPNKLMHLLTLCQILQLKKQGLADADMIVKACDSISQIQVEKIIYECDKNSNSNTEKDKSFEEIKSDEEPSEYIIPLDDDAFESAFLCIN
ncbi:Myosin type-2 heavy chain 1 [Pichia californica]|uniref:Myosin type-2 heavy chain 1 n=1 Tax=Pichia californica TaxID=460514 RepID=A0A9P6WMU2_9ASCO|nr:Myosin type-2 heavy chain 1 [[Candida] californica]